MSKLKNAPLIEVIFELRWGISNSDDLAKAQYIYGDLYNELKEFYPYREAIVPAEVPIEMLINKPIHRFRKAKNDYPLCQVGPGIITHNTIDKHYFWNKFYENTTKLIEAFSNVFHLNEKITTSLLYIDLIPFDFTSKDVYKFINDHFNIEFKQSFFEEISQPFDLNFGFYYKTKFGNLELTFRRGRKNENEEGILLQTRLNSNNMNTDKTEILNWLENAHYTCSNTFKKLISTNLYNSFK